MLCSKTVPRGTDEDSLGSGQRSTCLLAYLTTRFVHQKQKQSMTEFVLREQSNILHDCEGGGGLYHRPSKGAHEWGERRQP